MIKTALEVIMNSKVKIFSYWFLLTLSKWISNPNILSVEFSYFKNTLFILISSVQKKKSNLHHKNMKSILYGTQEKEHNTLFFIPEVVKMLDGVRLVENLSIKDIALTCVALINCIDI